MKNFIMRPYRTFTLIVATLLAVALFSGCSAIRLGYNNGEMLVYWWLDSYVDINSEQRPWVKKRIDDLFAWHRRTQLTGYAELMSHIQKEVQNNATKPEILATIDELKRQAIVIIDHALPDLADLALSMQPDQIAALEKKFASVNKKYNKEYLNGGVEERQKFRYEKVMEQTEQWFGEFSPAQEAAIKHASDERPLNNELWRDERVGRQQDLIALLKKIQAERPSREATMQMLKDYSSLVLFDTGDRGVNEAFFSGTKEGMADLLVAIISTASPRQKKRAIDRMQEWGEIFIELAMAPD
jgi:hypothetical protein